MYTPEHFKETNPERIAAFIKGLGFGMLVTSPGGVPFISHLPFLFECSTGMHGKLSGHMAKANLQWQHLEEAGEVLVVFQGPHAYISPTWYSSPGVPTWNYAVAHLRGQPRLIEGVSELAALVERLTHAHEPHLPTPWKPSLSDEKRSELLKLIVGFEIEITDIQAKFKLSQNRPVEDQRHIIEKLNHSSQHRGMAIAKLMSLGMPADP